MAWGFLSVLVLYAGFALSWIGTFATTCTQNDTDSLLTGMILSAPFYLAGNLITGDCFGHVTSPVRERVFAAYYLAASLLAVAAIFVAHWRDRRSEMTLAS